MNKEKSGFSIELFTKETIEDYVVYWEIKHEKIVFCYIQDSFLETTFRAKSICHKDDIFDKQIGMSIAFDRCLEKREHAYNKLMDKIVIDLTVVRNHNRNLEHKFYKELNKI